MTLTPEKQKKLLVALSMVLALLVVFRVVTSGTPKTAPLTYTRGSVACSPVRPGLSERTTATDPLNVFLQRSKETFPGVTRDIFKMRNATSKPKRALASVVTSTVPEKTPEEIAADAARADLAQYKFLGSMTDRESTFFLSNGRESFIVKKGDIVQKSYKVKDASRDYVILLDTTTLIEARIELSGGEQKLQTLYQEHVLQPDPQQQQQPGPQQRADLLRSPPWKR